MLAWGVLFLHRMPLNTKHVGYYFRHPLMAVMLLWALTLPGQEVAVYSFLFHGATSGATLPLDAAAGAVAVQEQAVQAFEDAKVPAPPVLHLPQLVKHLLLLVFAAPADKPVPAFAAGAAGAKLLAQLLTATLKPNAP